MGIITLKNIRASSDITVKLRLKDGGLAIDWSGVSDIKAYVFSDAQKALAGRFSVSVDQEDSTLLICEYSASKPQYLGVNSIVIRATYDGRTKTYDRKFGNIVPRTADVSGDIVLDDPVVDLELDVEDVSSSILDKILAACIKATEEAREVVDLQRGPRGYSAYEVAVQNGFVGTEAQWLASLVGPAGESAYQLAVDQGYEGSLSDWLASLKGPAGDSAYEVAVQEGFVGTKSQWLASLVGPQGLSAYQVAVVEGFEGSVSDWLASLIGPVGPVGPPGIPPIIGQNGNWWAWDTELEEYVDTGNPSKGIDGTDGIGLDDVQTPSPVDGTVLLRLSDGSIVTLYLNHDHEGYFSKVVETTIPSGGILPDVIYKLGTLTGSVSFALAAAVSGNANHYFIVFETGGTAPTITWPSGIVWADGNGPTVAANKHYEISIMDGIAAYLEV